MTISAIGSSVSAAYAAAPNSLPSKSGHGEIDALLTGTTRWWHDGSGAVAAATAAGMSNARHTLTFSFMGTAAVVNAADAYGFQAMGEKVQTAVREALEYVSSVADLTFEEVASGGDIQFGTNNQRGKSGGYAYTPNSAQVDTAFVYMANDAFNQDTTNWTAGSRAWASLVHEIGHALGLKHPGSYNAGGGKTPGPYLGKAEDNTQYSLMSYNDAATANVAEAEDLGGGRYRVAVRQVQADGFQMDDLRALQYLYGQSQGEGATGARTFTFTDDDTPFLRTISNRHADSVLDASATTRANVLDLREGHFSSIGLRDAYGALAAPFNTAKKWAKLVKGSKPTYTGEDNFALSEDSRIDRAKGGSGKDTIVGNNHAANTIESGGGNDTIYLGTASSTVDCGDGTDTVCLQKIGKSKWTVSFDASTGTYTCRNGSITNTITGAESLKGWDGKKLKISKLA